MLKLWTALVGVSPFALRSLSALFGGATILIAAAAALELDRQDRVHRPLLRIGAVAFMCACAPMLIFLGQQARPYAFMIFAYSLATLGLVRLIGELRDGYGSLRSWALLAAGTELTLWSHSLGVLYAASLAFALAPAWLRRPLDRQRLKRGIVVTGLVSALYVPCLFMILSRTGDWHSSWIEWESFDLVVLLVLCVAPVGELTIVSIAAALAMGILAKRAVQAAWFQKEWTSQRALLVLWWTPPLMSVALSLLYVPVFLPRTLAAVMIPGYLLLAGALARTDPLWERAVLAAALSVLLPAALLETQRIAAERWDEVDTYLERNVAPGDELWLYPNDSALPIAANRPNAGFRMRGIPGDYPSVGATGLIRAGSPAVLSVTREQAQVIASRSAQDPVPTVWLVTRQSVIFDPNHDLPLALGEYRRAGKAHRWGYIVVQPFTRR
jgi:uncharacterized membrane protein